MSAIKVARRYELSGLRPERKPTGPVASINPDIDEIGDWIGLISEGSVGRLKIDLAQINQARARRGEDRPVAARRAMLSGRIALSAAILATILAVLAFE